MRRCLLRCSLLAGASLLGSARHVVHPDTHWLDTDGNRIESHGAGMLQSPTDMRWYWYGETKKTDNYNEHGVNCYSAETIAGPWTFEGEVFPQTSVNQPDHAGPFVIERPKVLYNKETKKFVMWFHLEDAEYLYRMAGVAQSDSPTGPFEYMHGIRPDGLKSLDMSLFRDPVDDQAYFIRSVDNKYVGISRLTPDYLNSAGLISTHDVFEGMALFRHSNGTLYMISSHLTGWNPNPLIVYRADGPSLDDPRWVDLGNPTGCGASFNSQPTYVVEYTPVHGAPYFVYMADDWIYCPNGDGTQGPLINACYVWLPIEFAGDSVRIDWRPQWDLDDPFSSPVAHHPSCTWRGGSSGRQHHGRAAQGPGEVVDAVVRAHAAQTQAAEEALSLLGSPGSVGVDGAFSDIAERYAQSIADGLKQLYTADL